MTRSAVADFPPPIVAATEAALDAGLFYDVDVHRFVLDRMGGPGAIPQLLRTVDIPLGARHLATAIAEEVKRSPRGTYAILRYHRKDGHGFWRAPMSDGTGALSAHADSDPFDPTDPQAPAHVLDRMVGYEIYACRRAIEAARTRARNLAALATHPFTPLERIRGPLPVGWHTYSTATVIEIDSKEGTLSLELVRRGSARRWLTTMGAADLVKILTPDATP